MSRKDSWGWLIPRAPERRMYRRCLWPTLGLFAMMYVAVTYGSSLPSVAVRIAFVLAPLLLYAKVFHIYFQYLRECDEFERKIELEAIAVGSMLCVFVFVAGSMLVAMHLIKPHFAVLYLSSMMVLLFGYLGMRYYLLWRHWQ